VLLTRDSFFRLRHFYVICVFCRLVVLVSTSASDWLERLVSEMTYNVLMGTLNPTHSPSCEHWLQRRAIIFTNAQTCPAVVPWRHTGNAELYLRWAVWPWRDIRCLRVLLVDSSSFYFILFFSILLVLYFQSPILLTCLSSCYVLIARTDFSVTARLVGSWFVIETLYTQYFTFYLFLLCTL